MINAIGIYIGQFLNAGGGIPPGSVTADTTLYTADTTLITADKT